MMKNTQEQSTCSFCGKGKEQITHLILGAGVSICDNCIEICKQGVSDPNYSGAQDTTTCCSFCGTQQTRAKKLVQGPGILICEECVQLVTDILADKKSETK